MTEKSATEIPQAERIETIQIGAEPGAERFDETGCTPTTHEGRPVITYVMGPADQAVRKIKLCSACEMVFEERAFPDASGITLEGVGGTCDRVTNYPGDETLVKRPLDGVLAAGGHDGETERKHSEETNQQTNENTTMDTNFNDTLNEPTTDWHPLPAMIDDLITADGKKNVACGSWHVIREDDGTLRFYRELEHAETREALPYEGDLVWDWGDHWATYQEVGAMAAPEEGWESETETVSASRFNGWE